MGLGVVEEAVGESGALREGVWGWFGSGRKDGAGGSDGVDGGFGGGRFGEEGVELAEVFLEGEEVPGVDGAGGAAEGELGVFAGAELGFEGGARAGDGVALVVEEGLDAERHFDVAAAVEALAGASLIGLELRELAFPEAEDVGGDFAEFCYLADAEVEFVGDFAGGRRRSTAWRGGTLADWLLRRHGWVQYRG